MFNQLDNAIKANDQVLVKKLINNIVNTLDDNALKSIVDDIFADTADDAVRSFITKRVQTLKQANMTDDAIKQQIKNDLDILFKDTPDRLKNQIRNVGGDIVSNTISKITKTTSKTTSELSSSFKSITNNLFKDAPEILEVLAKTNQKDIDNVIGQVSKLSDSEIDKIYGKVKKSCNLTESIQGQPSRWKRFCGASEAYTEEAYKGNIRMFKISLLAAGILLALIFVIKAFSDEGVVIPKANIKYGDGDNNESTCDKNLDDFIAYLESIKNPTQGAKFDPETCIGEILGGSLTYEWNGNKWI
jgi:hypothetical protein